jgi:hypothetical protein
LANRLAQPRSSTGRGILEESPLIARRRTKTLDSEPQHLSRRRHQRQTRGQRQPHPHWIGQCFAEDHLVSPCSALLDEHSRKNHGPERPAAAFTPGEQAIDQKAKALLELGAGGGFGEIKQFTQILSRRPRSQSAIASIGELVRQQTIAPEPIGESGGWQRGQLAERFDPESFQRVWQVGKNGTRPQQRDGEWS